MSDKTDKAGPRFPKKMTVLTVIVVVAVVLSRVFISDIEDSTGLGLDMINAASIGLIMLLFLTWTLWCLFFSRWKWWRRILGATMIVAWPVVFFSLFEFQGGDLDRIALKRAPVKLATDVATREGVDLSKESPDDFAQFFGSDQNGLVGNIEIDPVNFTKAKTLWKQDIGLGWSGFAARNGFAVTMEQRADKECVSCYAVDSGDLQWLYEHTARHKDVMNLGHTGPRATPTIHNGKVYAVGAVGNLVCLNGSDGTVVWEKDLNPLLGIQLQTAEEGGFQFQFEANTSLAWGRSGSPLIVDDLVVVPGGGPRDGEKATLLAFNKDTGDEVWRGGEDMIAYGSPVLATVAGKRQILLTGEVTAMGFDPTTGEQLWSHPRLGASDQAANTSQVTVVSDNQVLTSKGYPDGGGELITLEAKDGKLIPKSEWINNRALKTKLTSPVLYENHTYCLSNGFLECARMSDGERIWKQRGRFGHGQLLLVKDKLLLNSESGKLYLIDATPDGYKEHGTVDTVDGVCWNTLCLYGSKLLVRSEIEAACIELPIR